MLALLHTRVCTCARACAHAHKHAHIASGRSDEQAEHVHICEQARCARTLSLSFSVSRNHPLLTHAPTRTLFPHVWTARRKDKLEELAKTINGGAGGKALAVSGDATIMASIT